jgi:hypothetical protein
MKRGSGGRSARTLAGDGVGVERRDRPSARARLPGGPHPGDFDRVPATGVAATTTVTTSVLAPAIVGAGSDPAAVAAAMKSAVRVALSQAPVETGRRFTPGERKHRISSVKRVTLGAMPRRSLDGP